MNDWKSIDTAPKDGSDLVLWCETSKQMLMGCRWVNGCWKEYSINGFGRMDWCRLESYEIPTHWLRLVPPLPNVKAEPDAQHP